MRDQEKPLNPEKYKRLFGFEIYLTPVFAISSLAIVGIVAGALIFEEGATWVFGNVRTWIMTNFDWLFMITANFVLLFYAVVAVSPLGKVRLGGEDAKPDYSYATWLAMLFAAGVGIGLLFFGVLEPVTYFQNPPLGLEHLDQVYDSERLYTAENTPDIDDATVRVASALGIAATTFHWGLHGWAIYGVVGLTLAFFAYNRGFPLTIRSAFYLLFGERVWGWPGHLVDTFAILAGLFGLATSLGLGVQQVASGLNYLFDVPDNHTTMVMLIVGITAIALLSVLSGLDVGIKRLSQINIILALALLLAVIILGPTRYILHSMVAGLGEYAAKIVPLSNWIGRTDTTFLHDWTIFYWAWWIAWAPFVGTFIARISKGRTVREFISCVLLFPTLLCLVWFGTFGGTSIHQFLTEGYTGVTEVVEASQPALVLFKMFDGLPLAGLLYGLPLAGLLSCFGMLLTIIFFITSSDSGSLIIDTIAAGGKTDAPVSQRVFWCTAEGTVAIALLLGGGLKSMQAATLATGLPFAFVIVGMCVCVYLGLRKENP